MTQSKTNQTLFRQKSLAFQQQRLQGDVLIRVSPPLKVCWLLLLLWVALVAAWLASQDYTRKVTVHGWLAPASGIAKQFAGPRRGLIESLYVVEGQRITAGQVIATIRPFNDTGHNPLLASKLITEVERQLENLEQQSTAALNQYELQTVNLARQKHNYQQAQLHIQQQRDNLSRQREILDNRTTRFSAAHLAGHVSDNDFEYMLEQQLQLDNQQQSLGKEYRDYVTLIEQTDSQIAKLPIHYQTQTAILQRQQSELRLRLAELRSAQRYDVVASRDGLVTNLHVRSGQSAEPYQAIISIVPANIELRAQLLVPVSAAGLLEIGNRVQLKYDAYPFQKFGLHAAELASLSLTTINPTDLLDSPITINTATYLADAKLLSGSIHVDSEQIKLRAGMTFIADIELEQRSLWEWLIEPVLTLKGESR